MNIKELSELLDFILKSVSFTIVFTRYICDFKFRFLKLTVCKFFSLINYL